MAPALLVNRWPGDYNGIVQRRALRTLQRTLETSVPTPIVESVARNDVEAWSALAMLELRMLLSRGQAFQARRFSALLQFAAEAGLPVRSYDRQEINQLINGIDAVQAGRHFLARRQLDELSGSERRLIQWASRMWRARALAGEGEIGAAREAAEAAIARGADLTEDSRCWATCFAAEIQAADGEAGEAENRVLRVLSLFIGPGEARGQSLAYLSLATVHRLAGAAEESEVAAEMAYKADGSWTGPALWLAQDALRAGELERARTLLSSIPSPATDAYNLMQALKLVDAEQVPLLAITRTLELASLPPGDEAVKQLRGLVAEHEALWPARDVLAWKLLTLGRSAEARAQLLTMEQHGADRQSAAAIRLGLQLLGDRGTEKAAAEPEPEPEPAGKAEPGAARLPALQVRREAPARHSGFVGQISLFGVPELLQFICSSRRSGVLVFSSQLGEARIHLHEGQLYSAESPTNPHVGHYLVGKAAIPQQLADRIDQGEQIGAVLADVPSDSVRDALQDLLRDTVKELVKDWEDGWFQFERSQGEGGPPEDLLFSAQGVLLDALREVDEERR